MGCCDYAAVGWWLVVLLHDGVNCVCLVICVLVGWMGVVLVRRLVSVRVVESVVVVVGVVLGIW